MNRKMLLLTFSFALILTGLVGVSIGQVLGQPYRLNDKQVEQIIHRVEKQAGTFRKSLKEALKKSRYDRTRREDNINDYVKAFYQETTRLHDHFDHHKSTSPDVEAVLDRAARIDGFMSRYPLSPR